MPIGNQNIWDKGIGAGATNVIFGQQPQQTNFNPGALGADPNATATPATTGTQDNNGLRWENGGLVGPDESRNSFLRQQIEDVKKKISDAVAAGDEATANSYRQQLKFLGSQL